jgi:aspartate racemase
MANLSMIGILGGMGPEATILLQRKLVEATPARDDADHIPLMVDMNPQVPSRINHLIKGTGDNPGPVLGQMAKRLQAAGATALAMPCNTAHHYAPYITKSVDIPLLNMVELAADCALKTVGHGGTFGMLASPAVRMTQLFEAAVAHHDISVLWPKDDDAMLAAIQAIKAQGPCQLARDAMQAASQELAQAGAALQFVACSEFSIISDSVANGVQAVDTIDLLVDAIVKASQA